VLVSGKGNHIPTVRLALRFGYDVELYCYTHSVYHEYYTIEKSANAIGTKLKIMFLSQVGLLQKYVPNNTEPEITFT